ncbi:MAG: pili assembly chaperone [Idiomarinaceae bacterium]|nr:pili assembly chaperone [Idiomarinaceae bacterium]HAD49317.1 pili assembly chaperone [Idiomarina sp.]
MLKRPPHEQGFTLIEVVIGITVIAIVTLVVTAGMGPLFQQTTDPWHQVRATELAQSMLNEINARRFDENSPTGSAGLRCGDTGGPACTTLVSSCATALPNAEEASREDFDDVDDYHCLSLSGDQITNSQNQALIGVYRGYTIQVEVTATGASAQENQLKRIQVAVSAPNQSPIIFNSWRGNW